MESFRSVEWNRDVERRETGTESGKGIFGKTHLRAGTCIALYWGNLVDSTGLIQVCVCLSVCLCVCVSHTHQG